jgi:alpha-1,3-rhamnosyl/mannosyltransferase
MRIALDLRYASDHFPGIGRYVVSLARALAQQPSIHTLLLLLNPGQQHGRYDLAWLQMAERVWPVVIAARPFSLAEQVVVPRVLRELRADLYHTPYYLRPIRWLTCPAVLTHHDIIPLRFPNDSTWRARLLFRGLTTLALRVSDQVIAVSQSARNDLLEHFRYPPEQVHVVYHAAESRFAPQSPAACVTFLQRYDLPAGYLLTVGSNKPHKNLLTLIQAYALRPELPPLVIAGHWDQRYPEAQRAAEQLGLTQRIHWLPNLPDADLPLLYASAQVFVYPSRYEGFGLPVLEALASGLPVVAGNHSSLPEVVGSAGHLVDIAQPHAIADALARLTSDADERQRLRRAAVAQAAEFSWQRAASETLAVYQQIT